MRSFCICGCGVGMIQFDLILAIFDICRLAQSSDSLKVATLLLWRVLIHVSCMFDELAFVGRLVSSWRFNFCFCLRFAGEYYVLFVCLLFSFLLVETFSARFCFFCMAGRGSLGLFLEVMCLLLSGSVFLFTPCFSSLFVIA